MAARTPIQLTEDQIARFHEEGYLVVHDLLTREEIEAFLAHEKAPDTQKLRNGLRTHLTDPQWGYIARHPNVAGVARQLLGGMPRIVQTMYLCKEPAPEGAERGGAGVALHQDTHYLPTEPNTLMACWIAINDTDPENGGLCVVPGSHKGPLRHAHKNESPEHASWEMEHRMRAPDGREWTRTFYSFDIEGVDEEEIVRLTVPQGGGVFFTSMTIHGSYANRSPARPRLAFAVHYVRDGSWVYRCDVQDTTPVTEYSR